MKILILGYGQVGKVLADLLSRENGVSKVICGDLSIKEETQNGKITLKKVDLANREELAKTVDEIKPFVVVNASLPKFNMNIMDCCLASKTNYLDAASYWGIENNPAYISQSYYKIDQLEYNEAFRQNGLIGLINAGVSPGLTNLLARSSTRSFEEIDYIKIRLIEETKANQAFFSWCKEWLIDEINSKPLVYTENKFQLIETKNGDMDENDEVYDFPEPFGKRKVTNIAQDEICTIPLYLKVKNVDIKAYDDQADLIKNKLKSGKDKLDADEEKSVDIKTFEEARFGFVIEVSGKENGVNKIIKKFVAFPKQREINAMNLNANFITYPTALLMKAFIMAMPEIKNFGVFPPEAIDLKALEQVTNDVRRNGINILRSEISF